MTLPRGEPVDAVATVLVAQDDAESERDLRSSLEAAGYRVISAKDGAAALRLLIAHRVDLVLCEASFLRHHEGSLQHLSARQAGTSAREARAGRVVLTHLWPTVDPAKIQAEGADAFGAPVELAAIDKEYSL